MAGRVNVQSFSPSPLQPLPRKAISTLKEYDMLGEGSVVQRFPKGFLVKSFLAHSVIFSEGSQGDAAYILVDGEVEISTAIDDRKKVLAMLQPVSIFGEMALFLDDKIRTASAMTTADSQVVVVSADSLDEYMRNAPQVLSSIMSVLTHRLKATTKKARMVPNVPMAVARIINLFRANGQTEIKYDALVRELTTIFLHPTERIEGYIAGLAKYGVVEITTKEGDVGMRVVKILSNDVVMDIMQLKKDA